MSLERLLSLSKFARLCWLVLQDFALVSLGLTLTWALWSVWEFYSCQSRVLSTSTTMLTRESLSHAAFHVVSLAPSVLLLAALSSLLKSRNPTLFGRYAQLGAQCSPVPCQWLCTRLSLILGSMVTFRLGTWIRPVSSLMTPTTPNQRSWVCQQQSSVEFSVAFWVPSIAGQTLLWTFLERTTCSTHGWRSSKSACSPLSPPRLHTGFHT